MLWSILIAQQLEKIEREKDEWCAMMQYRGSHHAPAPFDIGREHLLEQGVDPDYNGD